MNRVKSVFISLYLTLLVVGLVRALWQLSVQPAWGWVVLALLPALGFFGWVFGFRVARTGYASVVMWAAPLIASVAMLISGVTLVEPWIWVLDVGLGGALLYVLWYSRYGARDSLVLQCGNTLPELVFETEHGQRVSTQDFKGPLLLLFYRGNWCPLCMAQIREVADQYNELAAKGVNLLMISPQSHNNTAVLAQRFSVPMQFLVDRDLAAARKLGIEAVAGLPAGLEVLGYDSDTVMPTVVITDAKHNIIFVDQTDNYRVRPEPATFMQALAAAGL